MKSFKKFIDFIEPFAIATGVALFYGNILFMIYWSFFKLAN